MDDATPEVKSVIQAFADAWNRHDMDAFAALFTPDAEFVNVVGLWWRGREEIKRAHAFIHEGIFRHSRLEIAETSVRFLAPHLALVRARWSLEGHLSPDGQPLPPRAGLLACVLRADGGRWNIVDGQNTDIVEQAISRPQ